GRADRAAVTEFELIDLFTRGAPRGGEGVVLGIGDDAALLAPPRGEVLAATVDAVVEGVHFDARFRPGDVGWKALAVNLSDLAAMGARPLWALCALATPRGADPRRLAGIGRGLAACARAFDVALVGGNVTRARDLSLTVTVVGAARPRAVLTRGGASAGDHRLVAGTRGDAARGLAPGAAPALVRRQRRPSPQVALGAALGGVASAALDVSDGLVQDLGHLCRASGAGAVVRAADLPLSPAYRRAAAHLRAPLEAALAGGEDYELLVAVPSRKVRIALSLAARVGVPLTPIGEIVRGRGVRVLLPGGATYRVRRTGHDHLG
ncbi:MAG: thiamine-phosphate kinase, partial [Anaeromyxobacteraceae bacterium]